MRRISVALAVGGTSLLVASCMSDKDSTSPRSVAPGNRASMSTVTSTTCDYNSTMKGLARDYFNGGSTRNAVLSLVTQMSNATKAADRQAAAFSIMKQVATARLTSATTTAAAGGLFVDYVLGCADLDTSLLSTNTALVLSSGIFEVRGGTDDATTPAAAQLKNSSSVKALAAPRWGVEATLANNAWSTHPTKTSSYLVFGYPFPATAEDGVGAPVAINTNEIGAPSYNAFELGTVPAGAEAGNSLRVGLCVSAGTLTGDVNLFFHSDAIQVNTSPSFCTGTISGLSSLAPQSWFSRLASVFAPKALVAQDFDFKLGGLPSGWSPFHSGSLKPSNTNLGFLTAPADGFVNVIQGNVVVAVTVPSTDPKAPSGTTVPAPAGIQVTLKIAGNNGAPATFSANGQTGKSVTAVTTTGGIATFTDFSVSKAGGYLATVTGSLGGFAATQSTTTTMFWIKNKTP